jgi:hypothetical protein
MNTPKFFLRPTSALSTPTHTEIFNDRLHRYISDAGCHRSDNLLAVERYVWC